MEDASGEADVRPSSHKRLPYTSRTDVCGADKLLGGDNTFFKIWAAAFFRDC